MDLRSLIRKKNRGLPLHGEEIRDFVRGVVAGHCSDLQIAALLMAIVHRGMNPRETAMLTREMAGFGKRLPRRRGKKRIGKHSTGGVGDKTTFLLGPLVAHYGVEASFMAGRGLGHTGGTIDKLSGIHGFKTALQPGEITKIFKKAGFCIFEQSPTLAPADRRLYALRDASATVESLPLIVASILSKKMTEGLHALVLDVKYGSGSLAGSLPEAKALGRSLSQVARVLGLKTRIVYSAMEQPLGHMVGNNLEILECLETLRGRGPHDLVRLTVRLAKEMLQLGLPARRVPANSDLLKTLTDGSLAEDFLHYLQFQGGRIESPKTLRLSPRVHAVAAPRSGWISRIDARTLGEICMDLGAGRDGLLESVDPTVGIALSKKIGDRVKKGEVLIEIFCREGTNLRALKKRLATAYGYSSRPVPRAEIFP